MLLSGIAGGTMLNSLGVPLFSAFFFLIVGMTNLVWIPRTQGQSCTSTVKSKQGASSCELFGTGSICTRRRQWHPTPVLLPGKSHGWRSLEGCNPWGRWGSDTTERLHFHFSLSCIGEGNGNPLQCCCLENPRDGGAWWAAVYGVAQSRTRLKQLSSSSSYLH